MTWVPPKAEGLWLAKSLAYADITEEMILNLGVRIGIATYGALKVQDLREMPASKYVDVWEQFEKAEKKEAPDA